MANKKSTRKKTVKQKATVKKTGVASSAKKKSAKKKSRKKTTKKKTAKKKSVKKSTKKRAVKKKSAAKKTTKKKAARKKSAKKASQRRKTKKVAADAEEATSAHAPDPRQLTLFPSDSSKPARKKTAKKKMVAAVEDKSIVEIEALTVQAENTSEQPVVDASSLTPAKVTNSIAKNDAEQQTQVSQSEPSEEMEANPTQAVDPSIQQIVDYLKQEGIVRTRIDPDTGNSIYQLSHYYLTRSVLEAERRADHWPIIAREAHEAVIDAGANPWRVWQALLTPRQQIALLRQRLNRGSRFRYNETRQTAFLSLLRFVPHIALIVAIALIMAITFGWTLPSDNQKAYQDLVDPQAIRTLIGAESDAPSIDEQVALRHLLTASRSVQLVFIHDMLTVKEKANFAIATHRS